MPNRGFTSFVLFPTSFNHSVLQGAPQNVESRHRLDRWASSLFNMDRADAELFRSEKSKPLPDTPVRSEDNVP